MTKTKTTTKTKTQTKYLKCSQTTQFVSTKQDSTHLYRINTLARFNTDETFTRLTAFNKEYMLSLLQKLFEMIET